MTPRAQALSWLQGDSGSQFGYWVIRQLLSQLDRAEGDPPAYAYEFLAGQPDGEEQRIIRALLDEIEKRFTQICDSGIVNVHQRRGL